MAEIGGFYKPEISVLATTGGDRKLLYDRLYFDSSGAGNTLELFFKDDPQVSEGAMLSGLLSWKPGAPESFFSCIVVTVYPAKGGGFLVRALPPYHPFLQKPIGPAGWRSSTLIEILEDVLDTVGVTSRSLSGMDDMEIPRFTVPAGAAARRAIEDLFFLVGEATGRKPILRPSSTGAFVCGLPEDIRTTIGDIIAFEKSVNIITREKDHITSFAYPVLFNQEVSVDRVAHVCTRSIISVRPGLYRLGMEVERI